MQPVSSGESTLYMRPSQRVMVMRASTLAAKRRLPVHSLSLTLRLLATVRVLLLPPFAILCYYAVLVSACWAFRRSRLALSLHGLLQSSALSASKSLPQLAHFAIRVSASG